MYLKKMTGILGFLCCNLVAFGQMDQIVEPRMSLYNPAMAGSERLLSAAVVYKQLSAGIPGQPVEQGLALHSLGKSNSVGLGLTMRHVSMGSRNLMLASGQYAYWMESGRLDISIGLELGIVGSFQNWDNLNFRDPASSDPVFSDQMGSRFALDAGVGMFLRSARSYAGFSVKHLFEPQLAEAAYPQWSNKIGRRFYGLAGTRLNAPQLRGYLEATLIVTNMQFLSALTRDSRQLATTNSPVLTSLRLAYRFHPDIQVGGAFRWSVDNYGAEGWDVIGDLGSWFVKWRFQDRFLIGAAYGTPLNNRRLTIQNKLEFLFGVLFAGKDEDRAGPEDVYF